MRVPYYYLFLSMSDALGYPLSGGVKGLSGFEVLQLHLREGILNRG